jgi:membrane protease YdiL (CAAX protease family)
MSARAIALGLAPAIVVGVAARMAGLGALWVVALAYHALCFAAALARGEPPGFRTPSRPWTVLSILSAVALAVGLWAAGRWALGRGWVAVHMLASIHSVEPWPLLAWYSLAVNPLAEELYWRGVLLPRTGVPAGALFFALMHLAGLAAFLPLPHAVLLTVPTFAAGWAWGWMRRASGSLWPCIVTHLGADAGILAFLQEARAA